MEILNQTNKYIEELGDKVSIQKTEVLKARRGNKTGQDQKDGEDEEEDNKAND